MRFLRIITEEDAGIPPLIHERTAIRQAARAVVLDSRGNIALLYVATDNYYKLPGGGVEAGETIEDALHREVMEEAGCPITIQREVGMIEEHRNAWGITQASYCYIATVVGPCTESSFTKQEIENGFELDWVSPGQSLLLIRDSLPQTYLGKFVQVRDQLFLEQALEVLRKAEISDGILG